MAILIHRKFFPKKLDLGPIQHDLYLDIKICVASAAGFVRKPRIFYQETKPHSLRPLWAWLDAFSWWALRGASNEGVIGSRPFSLRSSWRAEQPNSEHEYNTSNRAGTTTSAPESTLHLPCHQPGTESPRGGLWQFSRGLPCPPPTPARTTRQPRHRHRPCQ